MLTTQLYIKDDPRNEKDFLFREAKTPEAKATLVTEFMPIPQSNTGELMAKWDVVLGMTPEDRSLDRGRRGPGTGFRPEGRGKGG